MFNDLYIQLPEDFEEQYEKYMTSFRSGKIEAVENKVVEEADKKYIDIKEDIEIRNLDIKIKGNFVSKGDEKFEINSTDRALIDFFNYRSLEDKQSCASIDALVAQTGKSGKYIKNRISYINQGVKKIVSGNQKTNIDEFIKNESGRGYRLNPRFVIKTTKPEKDN